VQIQKKSSIILIDFDQDKKITGICFEHASENFNLDEIKYMLEQGSHRKNVEA
jgi:uncharacterized protein YuzE